jgi:glutaredoxin
MPEIVMYSLSTCPWCKKAKKFFEEQHVPFESIDYDLADSRKQESINREMTDLKAGGFPVVKMGREVVVGYKPDQYKELLNRVVRREEKNTIK